ncbi:AMP-binding protein [Pararobbsia alpina]|uniref:Long-chain-fatty-acid--CoA ligase n=1 Tax=Pararobbsia alpina TaxID=621374 RepID=A0A6S7C091_9BURK|nr:AMP-binding protein [Pararobbsia alpina]CAB3798425.1 Long-chain-fatty-acid--CoA ligase [Pararobbsia alpina]
MNLDEHIFGHVIANRACTHPDFPVVTFENGAAPDVVRTYRQLWENGQRVAQCLIERGMQPGDHVAFLMANHAEFVDCMVGASIAGVVFVPIDPRTRGDKLAFMLERGRCQGVIAADYVLAHVGEIRAQVENLQWVIGLRTDEGAAFASNWSNVLDFAASLPAGVPDLVSRTVDPASAMQITFTSGTTGDPKGIVMTHGRFCGASALLPSVFGYRPDDRLYTGLSLTHANAQGITLGPALCVRIPCVLSRRFTKRRLWDITRRHGCTSFTLLGGMATAIYAEPPRADDAANPVRFVVSAGMPAAIWTSFEQRFGVQVLEFYGAAEGGLTFTPIGVGPVGSIGRAAPNLRYRIVDEAGCDVRRGESGELLFRPADGTPFEVRYLDNPAASEAKGKDGWLWMGDIVHENAEGWLFFEYRKGGGLRHDGDFVNPGFVEKTIADSGLVDDVYAWGIAAASGAPGEKDVVVAVVPKSGNDFDAQALFRICRQTLEANCVPSFVQVVEAIPKTASEKPQDRILLEHFNTASEAVFVERQGMPVN